MSKVIASEKGYWGGMIREIGDVFDMPEDEIKKTPWVRRHDEAAEPDAEAAAEPKPRRGRKPKSDEPQTVKEAMTEIGAIQPDWVPPTEE